MKKWIVYTIYVVINVAGCSINEPKTNNDDQIRAITIDNDTIVPGTPFLFSLSYNYAVEIIRPKDSIIGVVYRRQFYGGPCTMESGLDTAYATEAENRFCIHSNTCDAYFNYCVTFDFESSPISGKCSGEQYFSDLNGKMSSTDIGCEITVNNSSENFR